MWQDCRFTEAVMEWATVFRPYTDPPQKRRGRARRLIFPAVTRSRLTEA